MFWAAFCELQGVSSLNVFPVRITCGCSPNYPACPLIFRLLRYVLRWPLLIEIMKRGRTHWPWMSHRNLIKGTRARRTAEIRFTVVAGPVSWVGNELKIGPSAICEISGINWLVIRITTYFIVVVGSVDGSSWTWPKFISCPCWREALCSYCANIESDGHREGQDNNRVWWLHDQYLMENYSINNWLDATSNYHIRSIYYWNV